MKVIISFLKSWINQQRKNTLNTVLVSLILSVSMPLAYGQARDYIMVTGSSTVYPFSTTVAERFGWKTSFSTPNVEATGSGGGFEIFCKGIGTPHPDIVNSSRKIHDSELADCTQNGITEILEVKIGYDGITLINSRKSEPMKLSLQDIFLALARQIPTDKGEFISNPYKTWKDVNSSLPDIEIVVFGPPPTSGTRDAFAELALEGGCKTFDSIKALKKENKEVYKAICHAIREDGAYIEAGETDNLIIRKVTNDPNTLGVLGFSFLDQNSDRIQGALIDGVAPEFDTIASGDYPISRPLYFYVKKAHLGYIPGIPNYIKEFASEGASGDEGYLADKGLIPLPLEERQQFKRTLNTWISDIKSKRNKKFQNK